MRSGYAAPCPCGTSPRLAAPLPQPQGRATLILRFAPGVSSLDPGAPRAPLASAQRARKRARRLRRGPLAHGSRCGPGGRRHGRHPRRARCGATPVRGRPRGRARPRGRHLVVRPDPGRRHAHGPPDRARHTPPEPTAMTRRRTARRAAARTAGARRAPVPPWLPRRARASWRLADLLQLRPVARIRASGSAAVRLAG